MRDVAGTQQGRNRDAEVPQRDATGLQRKGLCVPAQRVLDLQLLRLDPQIGTQGTHGEPISYPYNSRQENRGNRGNKKSSSLLRPLRPSETPGADR